MSDYLNQDKFEEKPQSLVFNGGKAGVVRGCKVEIVRKTSEDRETAPEYKLLAYDTEQTTNSNDSVAVYPVNKGYFHTKEFKSDGGEKYAVNELRHLLKTFGHEVNDKNQVVFEEKFESFNNFMDYTFKFIENTLKANSGLMFDVVVDYGNGDYPKDYLQMNGFPWYIGVPGATLQNKRDAILERPEKDKEDTPYKSEKTDEISNW